MDMNREWVSVEDRLPPLNVLVALIDIRTVQNDSAGNYPVARVGHLSEMGSLIYWSCHGARGFTLDGFTHWAELPEFPVKFTELFEEETDHQSA
jgi:hypothetical protein